MKNGERTARAECQHNVPLKRRRRKPGGRRGWGHNVSEEGENPKGYGKDPGEGKKALPRETGRMAAGGKRKARRGGEKKAKAGRKKRTGTQCVGGSIAWHNCTRKQCETQCAKKKCESPNLAERRKKDTMCRENAIWGTMCRKGCEIQNVAAEYVGTQCVRKVRVTQCAKKGLWNTMCKEGSALRKRNRTNTEPGKQKSKICSSVCSCAQTTNVKRAIEPRW